MVFDIASSSVYKKDFPVFKNNPDLVYLDTAASAQKPQVVIDAISRFYENDYANIHRGIYSLSEKSTALFEGARETVAKFIKASSTNQIVFTKNATESVNLVRYAWAARNLSAGDTILVTIAEHHSNLVPWIELAKELSLNLKVVELNQEGLIAYEDVIAAMDQSVKFLAITQMSNALGIKVDVDRILKHARNSGIVTLVDACQSIAHMPIDVAELGADFLVFSSHKLYGPTGVGVLYMSQEMSQQMHPFLYGGDMIKTVEIDEVTFADAPNRFEAGTPNIAGVIGLAEAIKYLNKIGMDWIELNDASLCDYALKKLQELEFIDVLGPKQTGLRGSGLSFSMKNVHAHDVAQILADNGVCVRAGHHCTQPLMKFLGVNSSVRFSFGIYSSQSDIDKAIEVLKTIPEIFKR